MSDSLSLRQFNLAAEGHTGQYCSIRSNLSNKSSCTVPPFTRIWYNVCLRDQPLSTWKPSAHNNTCNKGSSHLSIYNKTLSYPSAHFLKLEFFSLYLLSRIHHYHFAVHTFNLETNAECMLMNLNIWHNYPQPDSRSLNVPKIWKERNINIINI